jgi:predicted RNase H-like HicB family nuclease
MTTHKFTAFLEPANEGGYIVKCLELPVATQGETKEEALTNIKEAIEGYLEAKTELFRNHVKGERAEIIVESPHKAQDTRIIPRPEKTPDNPTMKMLGLAAGNQETPEKALIEEIKAKIIREKRR